MLNDTMADVMPNINFSVLDYLLFSAMLGLSVAIGIYFGCFGSRQSTKKEYLLGGKSMKVIPVAMSLIASHTSGIALLSVPADIYKYGSTYVWMCLSLIMVSIITSYIYMPVYLKLQLISTYEYLSLRFDNRIRTLASFIFAFSTFLYNPIVIYLPALAFAQATGCNLHLITPIVCVICIFYTTIGGLKAVVWTDTLQTASIAICLVIVFCMGVVSAGGVSAIWQKSLEGHRLDILDFDIDPTKRDSFWTFVIGSTFNWLGLFAINQATVQRFMAVPTKSHARSVIAIFAVGIVFIKLTSVVTGLIIYTKYSDCDPLSTKQVPRNDQLLPYYVMDVAGKIPGLPGLFIAGVFSAALSTLSTTLNTVSGTIYEDFISPFMPPTITQKQISNILKVIVVVAGVICTGLVFVIEQLGGILPLAVSFNGITGGSLLGLFTLGMFFPIANSKGALCGGITGLVFSSWMVFGHQYYKRKRAIDNFAKPLSTAGCTFFVNLTSIENVTIPSPVDEEEPFVLYRITFWYFTLLGALVVIVVGLVVSWITSKDNPPVDPDLISPAFHFLLPKERVGSPPKYYSVEKAINLVTLHQKEDNENN